MAEASGVEGQRMEILWKYDKGHRIVPCTGAIARMNGAGEMCAEFYVDLGVTMDQQTTKATVNAKGDSYNERTSYKENAHATRCVMVTVLIDGASIRSFADWLNRQADSYEATIKAAVERAGFVPKQDQDTDS